MEDKIQERKEKILKYFKENTNWIIYLVLGIIISVGIWIRTRNIWLMQGYKYIPDVDSYLFVRYAQYIVDHGKLMAIDLMRNVPLGANTSNEVTVLAYVMAYMYKFFNIFSDVNMMFVAAWYPPIFFGLGLIFFFLLVRRLFDWKVALLSSALLTIVPAYLYRTMAGVSDKEPLGMFFMFLALYLFVVAWQSKKLSNIVAFGLSSGIATGLMALSWGGVAFVTIPISVFFFLKVLLNKLNREEIYLYSSWFIPTILLPTLIVKYGGVLGLLLNYSFNFSLTIFIVLIIYLILPKLRFYNQIEKKVPPGLLAFVVSFIFILAISSIIFGPLFIFNQVSSVVTDVLQPQGTTRFQLTVAEGQAPHFDDWLSGSAFGLNIPYLGALYFFLFFFGAIYLFYTGIKSLEFKWKLFAVYTVFLTLFIFSQYSDVSILSGNNELSKFIYFGSILAFFGFLFIGYLYLFYKDRLDYKNIANLDDKFFFLIIWFLLMIVAVRGAMRIFFVFAPITSILASYFLINIYDKAISLKENKYKIVLWIILIITIYAVFSSFLTTTYGMAKYTGLGYDQQWQNAEGWVKQNTKEDSVFSHWWDYGYWVQTGFNRATVLDGGNYIVYWDHLFGRYVLTGINITRALEFLKTHKANYLLLDPSDIGKYPAYASIGSDENYDRLAQIPIFILDKSQTQETRNQTIYLFRGGVALDEDLIYNGNIIPRNSAGIAGIFLPSNIENNQIYFGQPQIILIYNNQQYKLSLSCVYFNDKKISFDNFEFDACLRIIPTVQDSAVDSLGAAYYLSPKVKKSIFGRLYLLNEIIDSFKLKYTDEQGVPLALYNGRAIGPLRIYEIDYPSNIKENPDDLKTAFPDKGLYVA